MRPDKAPVHVLSLGEVETRLRAALASGLPGLTAQLRMAPRLVLTKRASDLPQHAGQVSLPGGAIEPGERAQDAALREAREEIGRDPAAVHVVGLLTPLHIPVSGFAVHPVVGVSATGLSFRPAARSSA